MEVEFTLSFQSFRQYRTLVQCFSTDGIGTQRPGLFLKPFKNYLKKAWILDD
jgi:hypothetical protein